MDVTLALAVCGGVAEAKVLAKYGVSDRALRRAIDSATIIRVRRGCYALPDTDPVAVAAVAWRGVPTCVTRARQLGLPLIDPPSGIHLAVVSGRNFGREHLTPPPGITFHHVKDPQTARTAIGTLDVMSVCMGRIAQLAAVDGALHARRIPLRALNELTITSSARKEFLLRFARKNTPSPAESAMRVLLTLAKLSFTEHTWLTNTGEVDFLIDGWLVVEVDGRSIHDTGPQVEKDRIRGRMAMKEGRPTLRFSYADVIYHPERTVAQIRAALTSPRLARPRHLAPRADQVRQ